MLGRPWPSRWSSSAPGAANTPSPGSALVRDATERRDRRARSSTRSTARSPRPQPPDPHGSAGSASTAPSASAPTDRSWAIRSSTGRFLDDRDRTQVLAADRQHPAVVVAALLLDRLAVATQTRPGVTRRRQPDQVEDDAAVGSRGRRRLARQHVGGRSRRRSRPARAVGSRRCSGRLARRTRRPQPSSAPRERRSTSCRTSPARRGYVAGVHPPRSCTTPVPSTAPTRHDPEHPPGRYRSAAARGRDR